MDAGVRAMLGRQLEAAIAMLERAVIACPEELWSDRSQSPQFWYVAYHTLFWLDLYLSGPVEGFSPPGPFGREELDPAGLLPPRPYSKGELLAYLQHGRQKGRATLEGLTEAEARQRHRHGWGEASRAELLLHNLRHVQHHAGQLYLILRQRAGAAPGWVAGAGPAPDPAGRSG